MMGDTRVPINERDRPKRAGTTRDPEFEIPDPKQVDRDIEGNGQAGPRPMHAANLTPDEMDVRAGEHVIHA